MNGDRLVQIVDAALAEASLKSGSWLACRPGCCECCMGPFGITPSDAARLQDGLAELALREPDWAARVRLRAAEAAHRLRSDYPGDTLARLLGNEDIAENEPCPALDPIAGTCDLYAARPIVCRTFGPAIRHENGSLDMCELCYQGASDEEIAGCAIELDSAVLNSEEGSETIVAFALAATCEASATDLEGTPARR